DADDGVGPAVERQHATDHVGRGPEMAAPEPVAENDDRSAPRRILLGEKHAPKRGPRMCDLEELCSDRTCEYSFCIATAGECELSSPEERHAFEGLGGALPVVEVRGRHREAFHARESALRRHVEDADEAVGLVE